MKSEFVQKQKRIYTCKLCKEKFTWTDKSYWYGTIKDADELYHEKLLTFCGCMSLEDAEKNNLQYKIKD